MNYNYSVKMKVDRLFVINSFDINIVEQIIFCEFSL